jgi:RNA polymerase-binding transcription factor DksA
MYLPEPNVEDTLLALKKSELNEFRTVLEALRDRLRGDVTQLTDEALKQNRKDASGDLSNMPIHMADIGSDNFEQEFTISLVESGQVALEEIDAALARIREGTFGNCEECNSGIPKQRLKAIPYTPYCVECARKLEQSK